MHRNVQMFMSDVQHRSSLHKQSTDTAHSTRHRALDISAATVMCMAAALKYVGNIDKRKHADMFSTDKENFQTKVG